jgi:hypothetical protein
MFKNKKEINSCILFIEKWDGKLPKPIVADDQLILEIQKSQKSF